MCPICIATGLLIAGGAASARGLAMRKKAVDKYKAGNHEPPTVACGDRRELETSMLVDRERT